MGLSDWHSVAAVDVMHMDDCFLSSHCQSFLIVDYVVA